MKLLRPSQFILVLVCLNIGLGFAFLMRFLLTDLEAQTLQATEEIMVDVSSRMAQQVEQQIDAGAVFNANLCLALYPEEEVVLELEVQIYGKKKADVGLNHYITDILLLVILTLVCAGLQKSQLLRLKN